METSFMKKHSQLSLLSTSMSVAALLLVSTTSFAAVNYKGENYKGEAMTAPVPAATVAAVAPCSVEKALKDGFYVGAQVGYDSYRVSQNYNLSAPGFSSSGNSSNNATGFVGGLFAGYGQSFQDAFYLAGEVLVNTSGANQSNSVVTSDASGSLTSNSKFSVNTSYAARFLPGIKLNNSSLFYVPLGYISTSLKGQRSIISSNGNSATSRKSKYSGGFVYGLGMETAVNENFSLRGEYTHSSNNSFSSSGVKYSPYDNQLMVGLLYHFA
jgi:outer membrane immunogenic protein